MSQAALVCALDAFFQRDVEDVTLIYKHNICIACNESFELHFLAHLENVFQKLEQAGYSKTL